LWGADGGGGGGGGGFHPPPPGTPLAPNRVNVCQGGTLLC